MGFEKQGPSGGNHVGGFLQMFDWNAKSRKKLFSSKYDTPARSKQTKRCDGNLPLTRVQLLEVDEITAGSSKSIKEGSGFSCSSSVMDEDLYETRAPGVVARLMGLDSLPKPTPLFDPRSLPSPNYPHHHQTKKIEPFQDRTTNSGCLHDLPKVINRPIEKFQTEVLPPKSAKSIPITHNKLLFPVKNASFIQSKESAHIIEAAARIIEPGSSGRKKLTSVGPSPARKPPSKVFENSQRKTEVNAFKNLKGQPMDKSWNGPVGPDNKGKSISLALQAKANVQKREGLNLIKKETCELSSSNNSNNSNNNISRSRQKNIAEKPYGQNEPNALHQNNQKHNCVVDMGKSHVKSSSKISKSKHGGKSTIISLKKPCPEIKDDKNKVLSSASKSERFARQKKCMDGNNHSKKSEPGKSTKAVGWDQRKGKTGTDVVSFTFTAAMARSGRGPAEGNNVFSVGSQRKRTIGHNINDDDALNSLLEEKLKELAQKVQFSKQKLGMTVSGSTVDGSQAADEMDIYNEGMLEESSNISRATKSLDCRLPSPVSVLDLSPLAESCNSSDTADSNSVGGSKKCSSSVQSQELLDMYSSKMFLTSEGDTELSDSASSNSTGTIVKMQVTTLNSTNSGKSQKWELEYVNKILSNVELIFDDYAVGQSQGVIKPHLFYQLEISKAHLSTFGNTDRRLLFDRVSECLDSRCRSYVNGGYESWAKGTSVIKRKERLADEVCKEISGWNNGVEDSMIDELVGNDMSIRQGKWLDFDIEAFELGTQIETRLLNSLIDQLVADMLWP